MTANIYGRFSVGELSGWIFFAHQVGAAIAAALAGWVYEATGSYGPAFVSAALMDLPRHRHVPDDPRRAHQRSPAPASDRDDQLRAARRRPTRRLAARASVAARSGCCRRALLL